VNTQPSAFDPSVDQVAAAVQMLKLLADPTRLRIVWALSHGEHSVSGLAEHVGAQVPTVSQHLAKLRLAQVVTARRDGTQMFYRALSEHIGRLAAEAFSQIGHPVDAATAHASDAPVPASG
jgi:DNA-binding transcriptional ArsR family regulator